MTAGMSAALACGTALGRTARASDDLFLFGDGSQMEQVLEELVADALRYRRSTEYKRLLDFIRSFRAYKPFNALLVDVQKPGSTFVAPAGRWHTRYGRAIRVAGQPLMILQPFAPVIFVFDVSDTEPQEGAPPLPREVVDPFAVLTSTADLAVDGAIAQTVENAKRDGERVVDVAFGGHMAGRIGATTRHTDQAFQVAVRPIPLLVPVPVRYDLELNQQQSGLTRYATLAHELGHLFTAATWARPTRSGGPTHDSRTTEPQSSRLSP